MDNYTPEKRKACNKAYYKANRERLKQKALDYYISNRDEILKYWKLERDNCRKSEN